MNWVPRSQKWTTGVAVLVMVLLVSAVQSPAVAAGSGRAHQSITHQQIFDKLDAGKQLSAAEIRYVKSTDLAALLPDPSHIEKGMSIEPLAPPLTLAVSRDEFPGGPISITSTTCSQVEMWWRQYSYLGSVIYRMHHRWSTCWNGSKVTAVWDRHTWFDETQGIFYDRGSQHDWYSGVNTSRAETFTQEHIEYCIVTYGCYYSGYPWIRAYRYGNGSHTWSHGL